MNNSNEIKANILAIGGKVWNQHGKDRVYMTCAIFNEITSLGYKLNDAKNKFFYDSELNAILRSYKGGKPTVEYQF